MDFGDRHIRMAHTLQAKEIEVACILKPNNVLYLSGCAPVCSGILLFPDLDPVFCTLWLDGPEAGQASAIENIITYVFPRERLGSKLIQIIKKRKPFPKRIGVEKDFMHLSDYEAIAREFPVAEFVHITPDIDRLRAIKSDREIELMRKAARISDTAMQAALAAVKAGAAELDIAAEAEYVMKKAGSEKTAFSTFVASGERTLLAHPIASRRTIQAQDPVVIDLGATWEGYAADICRTTFAGEPAREQLDFLRTVFAAQKAAAGALTQGATSGRIFEKAFEVFKAAGLEKHLPLDIGYGVGLRQSEFFPVIEKGNETILRENMVVALLQTTAFKKRIGGLRIEDTYRITRSGCERLTRHKQPFLCSS